MMGKIFALLMLFLSFYSLGIEPFYKEGIWKGQYKSLMVFGQDQSQILDVDFQIKKIGEDRYELLDLNAVESFYLVYDSKNKIMRIDDKKHNINDINMVWYIAPTGNIIHKVRVNNDGVYMYIVNMYMLNGGSISGTSYTYLDLNGNEACDINELIGVTSGFLILEDDQKENVEESEETQEKDIKDIKEAV